MKIRNIFAQLKLLELVFRVKKSKITLENSVLSHENFTIEDSLK